ncbi:helix-turn-helix transcriptional regulator [Sphingobacterium daejeonense]|uniref:helix-turn-helix transcriptional regulator n=1 Tax=Sphingobacterium daejeonense TaxID=371142 RepID=UPI0010C492D4|nr:helix-turn-helix transcriptional regulator [Sphingobacterium daejeonense]VTP95856.1 anaerobic benzoate catabolism transcriptional regulator [Sphingobacterium daejeonense]
MNTSNKINHIGRKIGRIRELRGMKQEALAIELGVSQQTVSAMENKENIETELLSQVAKILGVTPEAIENFSEEAVFNIMNNTFTSNDTSTLNAINIQPNFNPLDKLVEAFEENKKLYERLVQAEKDKVSYLEHLLKNK